MKRYMLEIYAPGGVTAVVATFESDTPFGAIALGDLLKIDTCAKPLHVVKIEHTLREDAAVGCRHEIAIITAELPDSAKADA